MNQLSTGMGGSPSTLRELIVAGNLQALKNAVAEHGEQTVNYDLDGYGTTPLLLASRQFRPKIVAWLCETGADMGKQDADRGWAALHWAAAAGDVGAAATLLDNGADSSQRDIIGRLPRHLLELAVCDASIDDIRGRLLESELQTHGEATHSLAVPANVYAGRKGARIVVEVRAPEHHDESDYVQLYVERLIQGQLNLEPPTPAQAMASMAHNLMPRLGSYRYVAKGWRSVVVFDSENIEVGLRLRAVYIRADGEIVLASEAFVTTLAPPSPDRTDGEGELEPEWQLFVSKSTGGRYFVNTNTGESVDELPEGTPFGTDNVEGYESFVYSASLLVLFGALFPLLCRQPIDVISVCFAWHSSDEDDFENNLDEAQAQEKRRAELSELKMSELKKRARAAGLAQDALDAADDLDDPKAAVVDLLVSLELTATTAADAHSLQTQGAAAVSTPVSSAAGAHQEPEPEQEANGVAMTPEQVRTFMSHAFVVNVLLWTLLGPSHA